MNKIFKFLLSMILVLSFGKVFAEEIVLQYSEWSTDYPSNIPEVFVESETRYHFYKMINGAVEYDDGYYTEKEGYIKDEASAREFYRYITNEYLVFNANNELVTGTNYCKKNFCYSIFNNPPVMINTNSKFESDYSETQLPTVASEPVPFTGDNIAYYFIGLLVSLITASVILVIKKNKNRKIIRA